MKKQKKQFILLCVVLVAFCGIFFGLKAFNQHQEEKEAQEEEAQKIVLEGMAAEDVTEFSYRYGGEEIGFVKEDGTWYFTGDKTVNITQTSIETMLSKVETVTASQKIEAPEDVSEYGFDEPQNVIWLKSADKELTITIGMYNSMTSQYYLMVDGDDNVYLVDSTIYSAFQKSVEDVTEEEETTDDGSAEEETTDDGSVDEEITDDESVDEEIPDDESADEENTDTVEDEDTESEDTGDTQEE